MYPNLTPWSRKKSANYSRILKPFTIYILPNSNPNQQIKFKSNSNQIQIKFKFKLNSNSNQIIILKFLITDPEPQRMSTYHSDGSSVWRSHAISRYLCLSFLLTTFVTMLVVVWKTQDLLQNKPQNQPTKSFSTEKKIPNSRSACSAHLALKKKKKINPPTGCAQNRDIKKGFYVHLELFSTR